MIKCTLQHFVGDFGQTALSNLQFSFFGGDLADAPYFRIKGRPQHWEL